jgi:hypothetical protein
MQVPTPDKKRIFKPVRSPGIQSFQRVRSSISILNKKIITALPLGLFAQQKSQQK